MDCHIPENHIENQPPNLNKLEPPQRTRVLVKLLSLNARLPTRGIDNAAGYDLHSCEPTILEPGTRKLVSTGIAISASSNRLYARIAPRSGLSIKGLDIGTGVVDSDY